MKIHRIYGMILRYLYYFRRSFDRMSDAFYWPTVDLVLWGLTSSYFRSYIPGASKIMMIVISGIILWIIVWRGQYEITVNLLDELWNKNLINLFAAPLKFSEWIISVLIIGVIKGAVSLTFATLVAYVLYKIQFFVYGFYLLPIAFCLIMSGWWIGFLVAGTILRLGTRAQTLAWTAVMIISPFSAIYYPLSTLPSWARIVAKLVPTSYVFEAAREVINTGVLDWSKIWASLGLNLIYLVLALLYIKTSFDKVLNKGLVKVY